MVKNEGVSDKYSLFEASLQPFPCHRVSNDHTMLHAFGSVCLWNPLVLIWTTCYGLLVFYPSLLSFQRGSLRHETGMELLHMLYSIQLSLHTAFSLPSPVLVCLLSRFSWLLLLVVLLLVVFFLFVCLEFEGWKIVGYHQSWTNLKRWLSTCPKIIVWAGTQFPTSLTL